MRRTIKNISLLAINGFNEVVRHRFFYGMAIVVLLIIGMGIALGSLSMNEQQKISIDFGLFAVQIILIVTSVFFGSLSITKDIERKILMTLITRSLSRSQYIIGKFLSVALVIFTSLLVLSLFLIGMLVFFKVPIDMILAKALWGIYLESMVILSISIFFGTFSSPFLIVCYSFSYFIIGHWIDTVKEIIGKYQENPMISHLSEYVFLAFPNLNRFNWRPHVIYREFVPADEVLFYSIYALSWVGLALSGAIFVFNKRDFV